MAFTLGPFDSVTTEVRDGGLVGPFESSTTLTPIGRLGPYGVTTTISVRPFKLPRFYVGDDGPTSSVYTTDGGMTFDGSAPRSFVLDGETVEDLAIHIIVGEGGMTFGGTAEASETDVLRYEFIGLGGVVLSGTATNTFDFVQFVGSGGMTVSGFAIDVGVFPYANNVMAASLPAMTASMSLINVDNRIAATLPKISSELTGYQTGVGTMTVTLPTVSAEMVLGQNGIAADLPAMSVEMTGTTGAIGSMDVTMPRVSVFMSGDPTVVGRMTVRLPRLQQEHTAMLGVVGSMTVQLPRVRSAATGQPGIAGHLDAHLQAMTSALAGAQQIVAAMEVALPRLHALASNDLAGAFVEALCVNTASTALSKYVEFPFNSMCEFAGMYLAAGADGLFRIDVGDDDEGENIVATIKTGKLDFKDERIKRITDFYVGLRADSDMVLRVTADEGDTVEYELQTFDVSRLKQRRVITAKGVRGKYWQFELENTDGCDFDFDSMDIAAVPTARRI